jgi:hypothetical protein
VKGKLVPCETLKRNSNIAGAAEIKGLSKKEYKMVMSIRKDDHTKDDQAPSSNAPSGGNGKKRKPEPDNVTAAASDNKKYRRNQDKAPSNASKGGTGTCELCNRSNHTTKNFYYLKAPQDGDAAAQPTTAAVSLEYRWIPATVSV